MKTLSLIILLALSTSAPTFGASKRWLEVEIGIIGASSDDVLKSAMARVEKNGFDGLLVVLDTPGGALEATRAMVKRMMAAPFPVVVWVGPDGAHAGSAGAFITLAGHVAAMAPGANIGAAHPVNAGGGDIEGDARQKAENDTAAFMESIAQSKGRNVEMARSFVLNSISITAEQALKHEVIDHIAESKFALMEALDGTEKELAGGGKHQFETKGVTFESYEPTLRQQFLAVISNPNIFYLLFIAGLIGIGFELTHPGALVPGVVGAISLILALISSFALPVSFGAMLLMVVGIAFIVAEMFIPSFGILGIGGFAGFVIGSVLLVDPSGSEGLSVSYWSIAPGAFAVAAFGLFVGYSVIRSERSKVASGVEAMAGELAIATDDFSGGKGTVKHGGTFWRARSSDPILKGDQVIIVRAQGIELDVSKTNSSLKES